MSEYEIWRNGERRKHTAQGPTRWHDKMDEECDLSQYRKSPPQTKELAKTIAYQIRWIVKFEINEYSLKQKDLQEEEGKRSFLLLETEPVKLEGVKVYRGYSPMALFPAP